MAILTVIATPIGNLEDISARALRALREAEVLACEDTRHTGQLLSLLGLPRPPHMFACFEHNEGRAAERVLEMLADGKKVALVSDAGYPGLSDPGYVVISRAIEAGHEIEAVPGASAIPLALLKSGLPTSSYTFKGFPPRKSGRLRTFLEMDRDLPHTLVFYESPFRVGKFLAAALEALGDRRAAVCAELTKKFERADRGFLSELAPRYAGRKLKGEFVVVIAGNHHKFVNAETDHEPDADGPDDE
jgi:16S rRNA (cytidine1402-2'-O)-methyltransferase